MDGALPERIGVNWSRPLLRLTAILAAIAGVLVTYALIIQTTWAQDLEGRIEVASQGDLQQLKPDPRVLILHVNQATMERLRLEGGVTQLPRKHFVNAVGKLKAAGARVVLFAMPFDTPSASDEAFRRAIAEANPMAVILVRPPSSRPKNPGQERAFRGNYAAPVPPAPNCTVASADFVVQGGKVVGLIPFLDDAGTGIEVPHAAFAATLRLLGLSLFDIREDSDGCRLHSGRRIWPTAGDGVYSTMWVQGAVHDSRNFADLLAGDSLSWARDRLVIIGDQEDRHKTPIGTRSTADILGHQVSTALQPNQGGIERWPLEWNLGWALALSLVAAFGAASFKPSWLLGTVVVALLIAVLSPQYGLRMTNTAFDTVGPTVSVLLAACFALVAEGGMRKRQGIGTQRAPAPGKGGKLLDATVMFIELGARSDVVGLDAGGSLAAVTEPIISRCGGQLEVRDSHSIVAVIGPQGHRSHAEVALACLEELRSKLAETAIAGIECGPIPASWATADRTSDLRSFGSTLHLASRLVDECRALGVDTLFGPAFAAEIRGSAILTRIGERIIRGFEGHGPIPVFGYGDGR
ncbi:MAG: hypothetical protein HONBIEJF_00674 [Fimbriimonadaceae bacterium]|nr:hypothetical protein [Fimbriimonadaceae bacterium]